MADEASKQPESSPPPAAAARARILRRWALAAGVCALLALLGAGVVAVQNRRLLFTPSVAATRDFTVPRHATLTGVARRLQREHLIPSAFALRVYARLSGTAGQLKAGEYEVTRGMTPVQVLALLNSGRVKSFWLTVPEGKWARETGGYLAAHWPDAATDFDALIAQPAHWRGRVPFPLPGATLEGYLFPNTYLLNKSASAEQILGAMLQAFGATCWEAYRTAPPPDGRTFYDVLILASLVEAEAKRAEERPIIAGVYINRLRTGMRLQCDATVLYAHGQRLSRVLYRDLEIDSPYNTYRYPGLPIGPICNPGKSAFLAALHPAEVPFLYYVARGDGSHVFSRTAAEHAAAIRQIRGQ